ncbi:MAG: ATP-binding protein [Marinifilaceae bacterium]|jgi:signal transduction histidine kinase|nr:ATP-binding protein [Marinifilaceae bacterium]
MKISLTQKCELISKLEFLSDLNLDVKEYLAKKAQLIRISKDDLVFEKGDKGGSVFIIVSGKVAIHDKDHVFVELGKGKTFGEYAISERLGRSASAKVIEDVSLLRCTYKHFVSAENKFKISVLDKALLPLITIRERMLEKDQLEEELTKQKHIIEKQKQELEISNKTKNRLLSIIAHDLKTPFTSLIGASEILINNEIDESKIMDILKIINNSAKQAYQLLDNMLSWSRLNTSGLAFNPEYLNIYREISKTLELYKVNVASKDISVSINIEKEALVWADLYMFNTIIRNIFSNAVKFTPKEGCVVFDCKIENNYVKIFITDTGVGIPDKLMECLTKHKLLESEKGTENESGTGIGLILCKEFIDMHAGFLRAQKNDKGSTFIIGLPLV